MPRLAQVFWELGADLKHGIRAYRNRRLSTGLAIIALGLAIGASTGIFSVLNALLLRKLPFSKPAQLAEVWFPPVSAMSGRAAFQTWYRDSSYLQGAAAFALSDMNLTGHQHAFRIKTAETSANFFSLLGIRAAIGRTFAPEEDIPGHDAVAVIGYGLWQELFAGSSTVIGKSLHLNGVPFTIIGVARASFDYPGRAAVWIPTAFDFEKIPKGAVFFSRTVARLKPGIKLAAAEEMFEAQVRRAHPRSFQKRETMDIHNRPRLVPLRKQLAGSVPQASWALALLILLLLLTASANVVHLLLSRTSERRQELAVRAALGASQARILKQLITEATLLTGVGALLGLLVADWTSAAASAVAPAQLAAQQYTIWDWRVLGFAAAMAVLLGIVFGVAPVWLLGRFQASGSALQGGRATHDRGTRRARAGLIAFQAALTVCLLTSSLVLGHTFLELLNADLGFSPAHVVTLNISLDGTRYRGRSIWQYYSQVLQRLRAMPGVEAAGAASYLPLESYIYMANGFRLNSGQTVNAVFVNAVTPGYFRAMGTGFVAGHDFTKAPWQSSPTPVIVNEAVAQAAGLGKRIADRKLRESRGNSTLHPIVGVVDTMRSGGPANPGQPEVYFPLGRELPHQVTFVAKVRGEEAVYLARLRDAAAGVDPHVPVYDVKTLDQRLAGVLARPRFYTLATGFLAALAVLLAAIGIYGTTAYAIAQRRHEMGVRMALGASHQRLRGRLLRESMMSAAIGAAAGIALSLALGRYLQHLLAHAELPAVWTCAIAAGFLLFIGFIAAWNATANLLSIDPGDALRVE